jgi:membrane dipeptidase
VATEEILKTSKAAVFASHSNCRSLAGGGRNLPDRLISTIGKSGGVVGVSFHRSHLTDKKAATIHDVAAHAGCIKKAGGPDAVALGSDFDGRIQTPPGLEDASHIQDLRAGLAGEGFTGAEIQGAFLTNFIRFWKSVEGGGRGKAQ